MPRANSGGSGPREHRLQSEWAFHYMRRQGTGPRTESYEQSIKLLGSPFSTVESFWQHYQWIKRPTGEEHERMPNSTELHLFRSGIKPMWEDEGNRYGGKVVVRVRKGLAARYWEDVCCAVVGEQFGVGDEICGAVLSLRFQEDILSIWSRSASNHEANEKIRETLRRVLNLGPQGVGEYKPHQQSLSGKQSGAGGGAGGFQSMGGGGAGGADGGGAAPFGQPGMRSPPGGGMGPGGAGMGMGMGMGMGGMPPR
jgi:translation initiation factor 4E